VVLLLVKYVSVLYSFWESNLTVFKFRTKQKSETSETDRQTSQLSKFYS